MIIQCPPSYRLWTVRGFFWTWKAESPPSMWTVIKKSWWAGVHALEMEVLSLKKDLCHVFMYCINDIHRGLHLAMMLFTSMIFLKSLSGDPSKLLKNRSDLCIKNTASYWEFTSLAKKNPKNTDLLLPVSSKVKMAQLKQRMYFL